MKNFNFLRSPKQLFLLLSLVALIFFTSKYMTAGEISLANTNFYPLPPDSTIVDSTSTYSLGDTIGFYLDGQDTVYMLASGTETDSLADLEKSYNATTDIAIQINGGTKTVQAGDIGINLTEMFDHAPISDNGNYTLTPNPYAQFINLAPKTVRIFSGSGAKFMHPLGSMNDELNNPNTGLMNGGYGLKISDIVAFYDKTNNFMDYPAIFPDGGGGYNIVDDMTGGILPFDGPGYDGTWMGSGYEDGFRDDYNTWLSQTKFDPTDIVTYPNIASYPLAINDFIELIKETEEAPANLGLRINVLYVANIWCAPVSECKDVINFIRNASINLNYSVNLVGVEIGSEVFSRFHEDAVGFNDFCHYYDYINGGDYLDFGYDFDLSDVLPPAMLVPGAHDFLTGLNTSFEVQIGLPALNVHDDVVQYPFKIAEDIGPHNIDAENGNPIADGGCKWNEQLVLHYGDMIGSQYKFDAVILHTYYGAQDAEDEFGVPIWGKNWGQMIISTPGCLDGDALTAGYQNFTTAYDYTTTTGDPNLSCAFDKSVSLLPATNTLDPAIDNGNFRDFTRSRFRDFFIAEGESLHFTAAFGTKAEHPELKDVWVTEANILNNTSFTNSDPEKDRLEVYFNSTVHCFIKQGWALNAIKANIDASLRQDFMPYVTFQNYLGGTPLCLMNLATGQDLTKLGVTTDCDELEYPYYVTRATYHSDRQLNPIQLRALDIMNTTSYLYTSNPNLPPTVFVSPAGGALYRTAYVYYTNYKNVPQKYICKPGTFGPSWGCGAGNHISLEEPRIYTLNPDQLYSSAGHNTLWDFNDAYDPDLACSNTPTDHRYEILSSTPDYPETAYCPGAHPADLPLGSTCVTVPANSCGYFILNLLCKPDRLGEFDDIFEIYPNPTDDYFIIADRDEFDSYETLLELKIFDIMGNQLYSGIVHREQKISISNFPVGVYLISIKKDGHQLETEQLVKMH